MRRLGLLCAVLAVGACQKDSPPEESKVTFAPDTTAKVPPLAVARFEAEMQKMGVDLTLHEVNVEELPDTWILWTSYIHAPPGLRGSDPDHPDYEVEIWKKDFSVKRVNGMK